MRDAMRGSRPVIMGILNVTPDSFSDGGEFDEPGAAIDRGVELHEQGADLVDVGGESTRPGAQRVPVAEEQRRVLPVVEGLVGRGVAVSVDTMNSETARAVRRRGCDPDQRRLGRTRRPRDVPHGRRARRAVHRDALARPQHRHGCARHLRRRRRRRAQRAEGAARRAVRVGCRPRQDHRRSGHRLRQDRRAQLGAARPARRAAVARASRARRRLAQAVPRRVRAG